MGGPLATLMWLDLGGRYLPHKLAQKGEAIPQLGGPSEHAGQSPGARMTDRRCLLREQSRAAHTPGVCGKITVCLVIGWDILKPSGFRVAPPLHS